MAIFSFAVLTLWLLTWVMWFFCLPGSKWFDKQVQYESWEFNGLAYVIIATGCSIIAGIAAFCYVYIPNVDFGVLVASVFVSACTLICWIISFSVFALRDFHKRLRKLKDY